MSTKWFFKQNDHDVGPLNFRQLKHLFDSGELEPVVLVRNEASSQWVSAAMVPGLTTKCQSTDKGHSMPKENATSIQAPLAESKSDDSLGVIAKFIFAAALLWCLKWFIETGSASITPEQARKIYERTNPEKLQRINK